MATYTNAEALANVVFIDFTPVFPFPPGDVQIAYTCPVNRYARVTIQNIFHSSTDNGSTVGINMTSISDSQIESGKVLIPKSDTGDARSFDGLSGLEFIRSSFGSTNGTVTYHGNEFYIDEGDTIGLTNNWPIPSGFPKVRFLVSEFYKP